MHTCSLDLSIQLKVPETTGVQLTCVWDEPVPSVSNEQYIYSNTQFITARYEPEL